MSKRVDDREKAADVVVSSIEEHGPTIARKAAIILREVDPTANEAGIAQLLQQIGKTIRAKNQRLLQTHAAHQAELNDDAAPRAMRDEAAGDLRGTISRFRATISAVYGEAGLRALGMLEPPLPGPDAIRAYVRLAITALTNPDVQLIAIDAAGPTSFNTAAAAEILRPTLAKLEGALSAVAAEAKQGEKTLIARDLALDENDKTFLRGASLFEQFARFVGEEEVAARVRPSGRDPGTLAEQEPVDEEPTRDAAPSSDATPRPRIPIGFPGAEPFEDET